MRRVFAFGLLCGLGVVIAGCANPNTKATHIGFGSTTDAITTGPALRIVTERPRGLVDGQVLPTMCTEPSPDVAIAFGTSFSGQGSFSEPNGPSVSGNVSGATTEAATQLAGRTAGVLALRDGLYAACQAYVNGVLGHDAYSLVLSQYGNLLVALAGTQTSGTPVGYTAQESATLGMMVACLSEHDPTRIRPYKPNGKPDLNPLLTERGCGYLFAQIARGQLLKPPKKAAETKAKTQVAAPLKPGEKVVTMTKKEVSGSPLMAVAASSEKSKN